MSLLTIIALRATMIIFFVYLVAAGEIHFLWLLLPIISIIDCASKALRYLTLKKQR